MTETAGSSLPLLWRLSLLLALLAAVTTRMLLSALLPQMKRSGFVAVNYRGTLLPSGGGIIPIVVSASALLFWQLTPLGPEANLRPHATASLLATLGFGLAGLMDDAFGDRTAGGLRGHWQRLVQGDVTTGGIKALFGLLVAGAASAIVYRTLVQWLLNTFLVAGFANAVNLFDVRPGRALKVFFLAAGALWLIFPNHPAWIVVLPSVAALIAFAPEDFGGRAMLGDSGANAAGALLGVAAAMTAGVWLKVLLGVLLAALHVATERGSITTFIGKTSLLRRIDEWGRRPRREP